MTATIVRGKFDARRCGLYTGYGPAWVWKYKLVGADGTELIGWTELGHIRGSGTARYSLKPRPTDAIETMLEAWSKVYYKRGPRGGWQKVKG